MNIIITEAQYNKLTEEKLREFLYGFWNNQKKHGEKPSLDDMLYKVLGFNKNTREDYDTIRPLWYRYNGGYEKIKEKLVKQIDGKNFNLVDSELNIDTTIKVVGFDNYNEFLVIVVDIDPRGTIEYVYWDEDEEQEFAMNTTIMNAYQEAQSNYESGDLMGILRSSVYSFFYDLLDEYGVPIDVDIDLVAIQGSSSNSINESIFDEMDGIKAIKKYWKSKLNKGEDITFDKDELEYFNITEFSPKLHAQEVFYELKGGDEYTTKFIDGLLNKTFSTKDFSDRIVGGYDFEWVITHFQYQDFRYFLYGKTFPNGTVTMMDGRNLPLHEALENEDFGFEIQNEVDDVVQDCMKEIITTKTGAHIKVPLIIISEE